MTFLLPPGIKGLIKHDELPNHNFFISYEIIYLISHFINPLPLLPLCPLTMKHRKIELAANKNPDISYTKCKNMTRKIWKVFIYLTILIKAFVNFPNWPIRKNLFSQTLNRQAIRHSAIRSLNLVILCSQKFL